MEKEDGLVERARISEAKEIRRELEGAAECSKEAFYQRFKEAGMVYGEVFKGVENVRPGVGKTSYDVRVVDIGETLSRGLLDQPFLISPATLDAAWQGWLGSTYQNEDGFGSDPKLLLPTFIGELEISAEIAADAGALMAGSCRSLPHGLSKLSADIDLSDNDLSKVIMSVRDFQLSRVDGMEDSEAVHSPPL